MAFRSAHHVVSRLVTDSTTSGQEISAERVSALATEEHGKAVQVDEAFVARVLDPLHMVRARDIAGGPAPQATEAAAARSRERLTDDREAVMDRRNRLDAAFSERRRLAHTVISGS